MHIESLAKISQLAQKWHNNILKGLRKHTCQSRRPYTLKWSFENKCDIHIFRPSKNKRSFLSRNAHWKKYPRTCPSAIWERNLVRVGFKEMKKKKNKNTEVLKNIIGKRKKNSIKKLRHGFSEWEKSNVNFKWYYGETQFWQASLLFGRSIRKYNLHLKIFC